MNRLVPKLKPEFIILNSNSHFIALLVLFESYNITPSDNHRREFIVLLIFNENLIIKSLSNLVL